MKVAEATWIALPLSKRDGDILFYEVPVTEKEFDQLYFRFAGKTSKLPCYRKLTIYAESIDIKLCYNEDPKYPKYWVPVFVMDAALRNLCDPKFRDEFIGTVSETIVGTDAIFHVPFDLAIKGSYRVKLGGLAAKGIIKKYWIIIELEPTVESYDHVLFYK